MNYNKTPHSQVACRNEKIIIWSLIVAIAISIILVTWPPLHKMLHQFDIQALKAVNSTRIKALDPVFLFITNTSSILCLLITGVILLAGQIKKSSIVTLQGLQLLVTFLTSFVVIKSLKYLIGRERPYITYNFLDKLAQSESLSFPSGHTFEAFAFATAVVLQFKNRWLKYAVFFWATLVGLSRMTLGVHYLSDVIGGVIFGVLTAYFVHVLYRRNILATG